MVKHKVWQAIPPSKVPKGTKIINSTWAMKKKAMGQLRARVTARELMQIPGVHYDWKTKVAPVTNEMTIQIILTLMIMAIWLRELLDVKGAFLHGDFGPKEVPIPMKIPQGFKISIPTRLVVVAVENNLVRFETGSVCVLESLLLKAFGAMNFERSKADPYLYCLWTKHGLITWISWV
jgi:hypothetical protein